VIWAASGLGRLARSGSGRRCLAAIFVAALSVGSSALGQSRGTGLLAGRLTGEDGGALPGAAIRIESPTLIGGPRDALAGRDGRFRFAELPPGTYAVTASLAGYKTVRLEGIELSAGTTRQVSVPMVPYLGTEIVRVQANPAVMDPRSSSAGTILTPDLLAYLPTDRDPSHMLDLAPGINIESAYGGAEESGNAYQMDGVDISDPEGGAPWSFFNYSLIEEVDVAGLGAPAEYGQFTGAVVNSITKSGGNDFAGMTETLFTNKALTGSNSKSPDFASSIQSRFEQVVQAGGPIRRDRLWYLVAAQYVRDRSSEGGPTQSETDPRLFAKLTWQATPAQTFQGWIEWDHTRITGSNGDAFTPLEATTGEDDPNLVWNFSWRGQLSGSTIVNVAWGGYSGTRNFDPARGFSTPGRFDLETERACCNASRFEQHDRLRNQVNASISHHLEGFVGSHDLQAGVEIERSSLRDASGFPGSAFYQDNAGPEIDPSTGQLDRYTLAQFGGAVETHAVNERVSAYVQDSWRITPRFTLNPGLRLDLNRGRVSSGVVFRTSPLAPRIGFAWDIAGDGRSILKAHYGRYYEALYADFYEDMDPGAFSPLKTQKIFATSGYMQTIGVTPGQRFAMDHGIRQPYLDQIIAGFDRDVGSGVVVGGTLVYRRNKDLIETVSRDGRFVPVRGIVPGTGQKVTLYDAPNASTDVLFYTNPSQLYRDYRALILTATRRLAGNWQLEASAVVSRTRGNTDNLGPAGTESLGTGSNTPDYYGHFLDTPNSLVNAEGRLTHDQTAQLKLQGTRIFPSLHLAVSADYTFHSGDTWTPQADCLLTDEGNGVVGDGIRGCHAFPQGTVRYFAEPRGNRRLPSRNELDLRVEWNRDFEEKGRLRIAADVFNLNNQGRPTEVETFVGDELGQPATWNFPRNVRLAVGYSW